MFVDSRSHSRSIGSPEGLEKSIKEPELERRIGHGRASQYLFVPTLEGDVEAPGELSEVTRVKEYAQNGLGGIYIVQFALLYPRSEDVRKMSRAYFLDGQYQGEVDEDAPLYLREEDPESKVTSGYFINRPKLEGGDNLLLAAKEKLDREDSVI